MSEIANLEPKAVWNIFDKICSFPHPSKHEEALATWIVDFAKNLSLEVKRDKVGNVIIKKPATLGRENRKKVVLQAHIDMVPQKNEDTDHNFLTDPILPYIDGDWVSAKGTTLGADNGMGMAACLAVLEATDIEHGPLEVLLTIDEEAGMTGAFGLEEGWLEGDVLLNTDSEQIGEVYMGCAGGVDAQIKQTISREALPEGFITKKLTLKGLKGGHSGVDIHLGRGNANKLLARFLFKEANFLGLRLIDFNGGSLRNAIPREASVTVAFPSTKLEKLKTTVDDYEKLLLSELSSVEPDLKIKISEGEEGEVFKIQDQIKFFATLNACPNGVIRMSDDFEGVVETSLNAGVVTTEKNSVQILCLIRSLMDSGREQVEEMLTSLSLLAGASCDFSGAYPGWKPDPNSEVAKLFREVYESMYGEKPNIMVIHAGLECGLFKKPYPKMDMVSFGPTIKYPHSPDEKVEIKTVAEFFNQMKEMLKAL